MSIDVEAGGSLSAASATGIRDQPCRRDRRRADGQRHRPCLRAGRPDVVLLDVKPEALTKALATDRRATSTARSPRADHARTTSARAGAHQPPRPTTTEFGDADLVIEAATEKEEIKRAIFKALMPHLKPHAILASNTSSISITRLAAATDRPEKFIGMHFMNPVPVMKLVEIIRGIATDEATFQAGRRLAEQLGKTTADAEDFPAFIVNRILVPMINEAVYTLYEGVGTVERDRHRDEARRQPSDGAAGAGRFHRPGYLPVDHAGAV